MRKPGERIPINPRAGTLQRLNVYDNLSARQPPLTDLQKLQLCFAILEAYKTEVFDKNFVYQLLAPEHIFVDLNAEIAGVKLNMIHTRMTPPAAFTAPELLRNRKLAVNTTTNLFALGRILALILGINETRPHLKKRFHEISHAQKGKLVEAIIAAVNSSPKKRGTFLDLYHAFDQVFLRIDPTQLSDEDSKALNRFFKSSDVNLWGNTQIYQFDDGRYFRFKYPIVKNQVPGFLGKYEYNCVSDLSVGEGGVGQVKAIVATVMLNGDKCVATDKQRVLKLITVKDIYSPTLFGNLRMSGLQAQMPIQAGNLRFVIMQKLPGIELFSILDDNNFIQTKTDTRLAYSRAIFAVYQSEFIEHQLLHCDIKPENILMDTMIDTGTNETAAIARIIDGDFVVPESIKRWHRKGTPFYMAPELSNEDALPTRKSEVFSLGCVLALIWGVNLRFYKQHVDSSPKLAQAEIKRALDAIPDLDASSKVMLSDTLSKMLESYPAKRNITVEHALVNIDSCYLFRQQSKPAPSF